MRSARRPAGNGRKPRDAKPPMPPDRIHDPARLAAIRAAIAAGRYEADRKIGEILDSFLTDLR